MKFKIIATLLIVILLITGCNAGYWKEKETNDCVKEKWVKSSGSDDQKYLIGMQSGEVYQITDSFFKWNWESSDIYNQIDEDECYKINYFGWRIGFFSTYKVINEVELINTGGQN